jgi:hypothetical protein
VPAGSWSAIGYGQHGDSIYGQPGTVRTYSPRPAALNDENLGGPLNQPSSVAPNWFLPSIYFWRPNGSTSPRSRWRNGNPLPVPAVAVTRVAAQTQLKPRIGGRTVTPSVRPFTRWPLRGGTR